MSLSELQAKDFIMTECLAAWTHYQTIFNCGTIPRIGTYSHKTSIAGKAARSGLWIEISVRFTMIDPDEMVNTIYHELAHIIQGRLFPNAAQAHGPEFRFILDSVGRDNSTYHSMNSSKAKSVSLGITIDDL